MPLTDPQAVADRAHRRRRRTVGWLVAANLAVAALLAALVYTVLGSTERSYATQAKAVAEGMVAIAQVNVASELGRVDAVLRATAEELGRVQAAAVAPDDADLQAMVRSRMTLLKGAEALRMADATGRLRWGDTLPAGAPRDVSDRAFFQQARSHRGDATLVDGPFRSRASGNWVMAFVRPVIVSGRFDGIVYVTVTADHFLRLFERYDLAEQDAMTLRRDDLRLLARRSPGSTTQGEVGATTVSAELRAELARQPTGGVYVSKVAVDGVQRTTAYRAIEGWPFMVFAGISNERFFRPWVESARKVVGLAALAWALVALASVGVFIAGGRAQRAMQALVAQTHRTQALLRIAGDGIHIVNREGRLVEMSDSFAEMLHSTREKLLGRPIWSWDANQDEAHIRQWLATLKAGDRQRVEVQHRRDDGGLIDVELHLRMAEIDGELFVFGSGRDVTERKRLLASLQEAHETLAHAAFHDALTGLPNRLLLADRLTQALAVAARERTRVAVCYMDLDGFKAVNDQRGHEAGDALLAEVARRLRASVRPSDTAARLGGDEFVVVLSDLRGDEWQGVLERVSGTVSEPIALADGGTVQVGITVGVALSDGAPDEPAALLERADRVMLQAKRGGKGRIAVA